MAKEDSQGAAQFGRDFGYLGKFLLSITDHASTLPGQRGERLRALLDGEVAKWEEIRQLLLSTVAPPSSASQPDDAAARLAVRPGGSSAAMGLTVGSLLGDRRRQASD